MKLVVVVAGTIAENKLIEKDVANEQALTHYLKGKIFRQGLEEGIVDNSQLEM